MTLEEALTTHGKQIGTIGRVAAIIVGSLHHAEVLDGRAVAQSIRLDEASDPELRVEIADLIRRTIESVEENGAAGLRAIDD